MAWLYNITARKPDGTLWRGVAGSVRAVPATIVGDWTGHDIVRPDDAAVRHIMPPQYRAAYDRGGSWWHPDQPGHAPPHGPCTKKLYGSRGKYLGMVKAELYEFISEGETTT